MLHPASPRTDRPDQSTTFASSQGHVSLALSAPSNNSTTYPSVLWGRFVDDKLGYSVLTAYCPPRASRPHDNIYTALTERNDAPEGTSAPLHTYRSTRIARRVVSSADRVGALRYDVTSPRTQPKSMFSHHKDNYLSSYLGQEFLINDTCSRVPVAILSLGLGYSTSNIPRVKIKNKKLFQLVRIPATRPTTVDAARFLGRFVLARPNKSSVEKSREQSRALLHVRDPVRVRSGSSPQPKPSSVSNILELRQTVSLLAIGCSASPPFFFGATGMRRDL